MLAPMPTRKPVEIQMPLTSPCSSSIEDTSRILLETLCGEENFEDKIEEEFRTQADPDETILESCLDETILEESQIKSSGRKKIVANETTSSLNELSIMKRNNENQNLIDASCIADSFSSNSMNNKRNGFNDHNFDLLSYEKKYKENHEAYICSIFVNHRDGILTRLEYDGMNMEEKSRALKKVSDLFERLGILQIDAVNGYSKGSEHHSSANSFTNNDINLDVTANECDMSPPSKIHDSSLIYDLSNENDNSVCSLQRNQTTAQIDKQKSHLSPRALFLSRQWKDGEDATYSEGTMKQIISTTKSEPHEEQDEKDTISSPHTLRQEINYDFTYNLNGNDRINSEEIENSKCNSATTNSNSDSTVESIEIIRSGNVFCDDGNSSTISFKSPTFRKLDSTKRIASTSGKKGLDTQRMRFESIGKNTTSRSPHQRFIDTCSSENDIMSPSEMIESPSKFDCSSIVSPGNSCENGKDFSPMISPPPLDLVRLSQSPIALSHENIIHHSLRGITQTNREGQSLGFSDDESHGSNHITDKRSFSLLQNNKKSRTILDTVETSECTLLPRRARYQDRSDFFEIRDSEKAPSNVQLKNGTEFYMDPLHIKQLPRQQKSFTKRKNSSNAKNKNPSKLSPEPFSNFSSREAERLDVICDWIQERGKSDLLRYSDSNRSMVNDENQANAEYNLKKRKGVIVALNQEQTMSVIINILKSNGCHKFRRKSNAFNDNSQLSRSKQCYGGTLLVVRSKDNLSCWESALRERTSFSVLNHALMSTAERRRIAMATKCAGFDIILTTFDALKSKEVATPVDEHGHVMMMSSNENGWLSSRSQSSQQQNCEILSVLHGIHWFRVLFVDELGRQSYLTKPGTSRLRAASAINSNFRFIFFTNCAGCNGFLEDKLKESRRQLCCVARALHMSEERAGDRIVGEAMLDFCDIQEPIDESMCDGDDINIP